MNTNKWPVIKSKRERERKVHELQAFPSSLKHRIMNIRNQKHMQMQSRERWRWLNHNNNILFPQNGIWVSFAASQSWRKQLDPRVACSKRETGNGKRYCKRERDTDHLLHLPGRRSGDQ
jgi:hypothetical protein